MPGDERDRDREPEGRRRQDDDGDQPRRCAGRAGLSRPVHRHGPPGEPDRRPRHQPGDRRSIDGRRPGRRPGDDRPRSSSRPRPPASMSPRPHIELASTEGELFTAIGREQALREALDGWVDAHYDYALIDCPPNARTADDQRPRRGSKRDHPGPDPVLRDEGARRPWSRSSTRSGPSSTGTCESSACCRRSTTAGRTSAGRCSTSCVSSATTTCSTASSAIR